MACSTNSFMPRALRITRGTVSTDGPKIKKETSRMSNRQFIIASNMTLYTVCESDVVNPVNKRNETILQYVK